MQALLQQQALLLALQVFHLEPLCSSVPDPQTALGDCAFLFLCLINFIQHTHIACALKPCLAQTTKMGWQMSTTFPGDVQICFLS